MDKIIAEFEKATKRIGSVVDKYADIDSETFMAEMGMIIDSYALKRGCDPVQLAGMIYEACKSVNETLGSVGVL